MVKARLAIAAASVALVAGGLLTAAVVGATAAGATSSTCVSSGKCYLVGVSPNSVDSPTSIVAGVSQSFTINVTNEATTQTLGSIQITAPAGFVITGASGGTASYAATAALFLNLGLSPGQVATLGVTATAPCSSGSSAWSVVAKQSNQFNGAGNGFVPDPSSRLGAAVSGSCSLSFTNQPNGTVVGSPITSQVNSTGSAVSVEVLDGDGKLLISSAATVTLAIDPTSNPGSGTLSGTTTVKASGGVAPFPGLSINQTGSGYRLVAPSPGITSADSGYFNIWGQLQGCSGNGAQCTGSSSSKTTTGSVTTSPALSGQFLGVGLGGVTYACGGSYQPVSDPLSFDVLSQLGVADNSALFIVTLELNKQAVQSSGHPGASTFQVCFGSDIPFTALPGTAGTAVIGGVTYHTGLLPDCNNSQSNPPCVLSRNKDNAGNEIVTFLGTGDAYGKM